MKHWLLSEDVVLKIKNVVLMGNMGTCALLSDCTNYTMVFTITNYPPKVPMPGAPFPIQFNFTIYDSKFDSVSGEFIFEEYSGTLPTNCDLGIPFGEYKALARNNKLHQAVYLKFKLSQDTGLELYVY